MLNIEDVGDIELPGAHQFPYVPILGKVLFVGCCFRIENGLVTGSSLC
jgi:hypothetical protein